MQDWWRETFPQGRQNLTIIDTNGHPVSIAYGEKGTGKPLILIHGIGSWSYSWRHCIEPLSKHFRVICFDAKGYGFSEKLAYPEHPGHQLIELERIIRALCNEPAIVVAISLGALVSLAVVQENPELFASLVLINVPIFPERLPNRWMRSLSDLPIELLKIVDSLRLTFFFSTLVRAIVRVERREVLVDWSTVTPEEVYWITYPYIYIPGTLAKVTEELQIAAQEIKRLQQKQPNLISKIQARLGEITCPTLIVWGDQDRWFPVTDAEKLRSHMPHSQVKIIENCGHDAPANCPEELNTAILEFLQDTGFTNT
ncbi:alpha/beta fold hydrolase [Chroogloeocystis siderophila]|uniref:Alpha/beta hydrolase n=1 Tax=Chroogloeocystis siderophila 5.2 s.c.1 TaxID=247279 RepID=A0A1U7HIE5_9CHRO|nr:alpha/beta hydrolase [Chroogloeocystis siderophila]OKH23329.1 alpha/beta hydrolase [Chroogloeocystis siderophila 5.2 s.c.1]